MNYMEYSNLALDSDESPTWPTSGYKSTAETGNSRVPGLNAR